MYKNVKEDIHILLSKYNGATISDTLKLLIEKELTLYLSDLSIMKEMYPYEFKLRRLEFTSTCDINAEVGIYNTSSKKFIEPDTSEWSSYKVQLLIRQLGFISQINI